MQMTSTQNKDVSLKEKLFYHKKILKKGIVPFVTSRLIGRFVVFFTVDFLLFLAPAGGSNSVGPIT